MNRSPFATLTNGEGRTLAVHYSAVLCVEQTVEGSAMMIRAGNAMEVIRLNTPYDEVMRELERARRAEIVSFGE